MKKILCAHTDNVLTDFQRGVDRVCMKRRSTKGGHDEILYIFSKTDLMQDGIDSYATFCDIFDKCMLSTKLHYE